MIVHLNRAEIMMATAFGEMRHKIAVDKGYYRPIGETKADDIANDQAGVMGEIAFGRRFNVFVDFSFEPRKGGYDFIYRERRIDVKTTRYAGKPLILDGWHMDQHSYKDIDVFVLAEIMPSATPLSLGVVDLVGMIGREEFIRTAKETKTRADGRRIFVLDRSLLNPTEWLDQF